VAKSTLASLTLRASTLGELKQSGWQSVPVKDEVRRNTAARVATRTPLIDGVLGFDSTVLPHLENALIAGHDIILLGERGQAKTRIIRGLTALLDEWLPVVAGTEINDDPYRPVSAHARALVADLGDDTPIEWLHRDNRFGEKLATPDTSIADLIGEVDPIKVAEGRYLSDELTLHYGLVPRSNRGIFAVNELPDLAERIQVGLLNVLEERDVQIRGHKVRLPLDILLVATANPEDYTNRGRIITPLKDRFGAQLRTHYPLDIDTELVIVRQEAVVAPVAGRDGELRVHVPDYMAAIIATISHEARRSPQVNQRSGVSVRLSIANYETMVANATRRALRLGERDVVPRVSDLDSLASSTAGKVEIEAFEDGRADSVFERLVNSAVLTVFRDRCPIDRLGAIVGDFEEGVVAQVGDGAPAAVYVDLLGRVPSLRQAISPLVAGESPAELASAVELVLEGLHLSRRLNKDRAIAAGSEETPGSAMTYSGR
jgi:magnesium chelatase subunit I